MHTYLFSDDSTFQAEIKAKSFRGAINALARQYGGQWRIDYTTGDIARYNQRGACVCAFVEHAD